MKKIHEVDDRLLEKIISVAFGDANFIDKIRIYRLAKKNDNVKNIQDEFKETADQLASFKEEKCPDEILDKVYSKIEIEGKKSLFEEKIHFHFFTRPVYTLAITLVLLMTAIILLIKQPEPQPQYSTAEIEKAEIQVKQTLAFVNNIFENTGKNLEKNILPDKVGKPINAGINTIKNYFKD